LSTKMLFTLNKMLFPTVKLTIAKKFIFCKKNDIFLVKILQKCIKLSTKTVFNIDNNENALLEHQISKLEGFPKDHVTLKTGK